MAVCRFASTISNRFAAARFAGPDCIRGSVEIAVLDIQHGQFTAEQSEQITKSKAKETNQFVVRSRFRDRLLNTLKSRGIGAAVYYPLGMHMQPCYAALGYGEGDFPATEQACKEVCALPMFPELSEGQQQRVMDALVEAAAEIGGC